MKKYIFLCLIIVFAGLLHANAIKNNLSGSASFVFLDASEFNKAVEELYITKIKNAMVYDVYNEIGINEMLSFSFGFEFLQLLNVDLDVWSFNASAKSLLLQLSADIPVINENFKFKGSIGSGIGIFNATKGHGNGTFTAEVYEGPQYSAFIYSGNIQCELMHVSGNFLKSLLLGFKAGCSTDIHTDDKGTHETDDYLLDINGDKVSFKYLGIYLGLKLGLIF